MEKLIKLLNEYKLYTDHKKSRMSEYVWANVWDDIVMDSYVWTTKDKTLEIISKKFWFIKWLVENDKIKPLRKFIGWETDEDEPYIQFDLVDQYIAYLSIQDNPIEWLCEILK